MGFFDFIGKAVGAVKDLVVSRGDIKLIRLTQTDALLLHQQQNPIVKEVANIAGVVAHTVPGLGTLSRDVFNNSC